MKKLNKKRILYLITIFIVLILIFTHFQTYLANDDLPYMYLHRGDNRITSFIDILKNQYVDYFNINGRVLVHSVLQLVLIFDKSVWSIINPIMIVMGIILLIKIIKLKNKNINSIISLLLGISFYLLMFNFKRIIYWVAGSVNYVWVFAFLFIFVYYFLKLGFSRNKYLNMLIIFILTAMHECTMVFTIIFILGNMLYELIKNKRFNKDYIFYLLSLSGSLVLLLSPSNQSRLVSNSLWNSYNLIEKILISIPEISKDLLNLTDIHQPLSYIYILSIITLILTNKDKYTCYQLGLIIITTILIYIFKIDWLYFILVLILLVSENYYHYKSKNIDLIILNLSIYAISYSNIISPTYAVGRPNYYFFMYIIFISIYTINMLIQKNPKITLLLYIISIILTICTLGNEIIVYKEIGKYHQTRITQIEEFKKNKSSNTLYLIKMPQKYSMYHMDINLPTQEWFTYKTFTSYYNIPKDTIIIYKED